MLEGAGRMGIYDSPYMRILRKTGSIAEWMQRTEGQVSGLSLLFGKVGTFLWKTGCGDKQTECVEPDA